MKNYGVLCLEIPGPRVKDLHEGVCEFNGSHVCRSPDQKDQALATYEIRCVVAYFVAFSFDGFESKVFL